MPYNYFQIYLIGINAISLVYYYIGYMIKKAKGDFRNEKSLIDRAYIVFSFLGGSIGILLGWILFDRRRNKTYASFLVFSISTLMIWVCIYFSVLGPLSDIVLDNLKMFILSKWWIISYLVVVNIIVMAMFKVDKENSENNDYRIPAFALLGVCFLGGAIGGLYGMYKYNHKKNKFYFKYGIPMIIASEIIVLFFLEMAELI